MTPAATTSLEGRERRSRHLPQARTESGTVAVLLVGFAVILMMLVGVVVDASAAYLQRQSLDNLADSAALAGANEVRGTALFEVGFTGDYVPLATDLAVAAVHSHLRQAGAHEDHPGLEVRVSVRDRAVVVRLTTTLDLPIPVAGITDGTVSSTGAAVVRIGD